MSAIGQLLIFLLDVYLWIIVISVLASWLIAFDVINPKSEQAQNLLKLLDKCTDPIFKPLRKYVPSIGGIDISPIIVIFVIFLLQKLIFKVFLAPNIMII